MGLFSKISSGLSEKEKKQFTGKIKDFQSKLTSADDFEKEFNDFAKIVNSLFDKGFGIHYKFTYEDLKLEINEKQLPDNLKKKAEVICDTLNEMEFNKEGITIDKMNDVAGDVIELVNMMGNIKNSDKTENEVKVPIQPKEKKKGLFSRFRNKKQQLKTPDTLPEFDIKPLSPIEEKKLIENEDIVKVEEPDDLTIPIKEKPVEELELSDDDKIKNITQDPEDPKLYMPKEDKDIVKPEPQINPEIKSAGPVVAKELTKLVSKETTKKKKQLIKKPGSVNVQQKKVVNKKTITKKPKAGKTTVKKKAGKIVILKKTQIKKLPKIDLKKELNFFEIIKEIKDKKTEIKEGVKLINKQEKILDKELKLIEKKDSERPLPQFKVFEKELKSDIDELDKTLSSPLIMSRIRFLSSDNRESTVLTTSPTDSPAAVISSDRFLSNG